MPEDVKLREIDDLVVTNPTTEIAAKNWLEDRITKALKTGPFSETVIITPVLARELLQHNIDNRALRPVKLAHFVSDIKEGRWEWNGESLIIASDGSLNNGQHRCEAVIRADRGIKTQVMFGFPKETRKTLDSGSSRNPSDHLAIEGVKYSAAVSAIARFLIAYEKGNGQKLEKTNRVPSIQIVERALSDPRIEYSASFPYKDMHKSKRFAPPSILGFCHYLFSKKHQKMADEFIMQVIRGINLSADDPIYMVRERLIEMEKYEREWKIEILIRAWNHHRSGEKPKTLTAKGALPRVL